MLYPFKRNDIFKNRIKTHPKCDFLIYDRKAYYNFKGTVTGQITSSVFPSPGSVNLYEMNIDRAPADYIYPFVTKDGSLATFKTISTSDFNSDFQYGDTITGSYRMESSLDHTFYAASAARPYIDALRNTLDYRAIRSKHLEYNGSHGDKSTQPLSLISVPSIFYGSSIKKGTVECKFYISGTLAGHLKDINENGELIQILPVGSTGSGSVGGVVLYEEGFLIMTGAWALDAGHTEPYVAGAAATTPKWEYFGSHGSTGVGENLISSSFGISFEGTNYIPTLTMLAHAPKGELNHSNNPTFITHGQEQKLSPTTGSRGYVENSSITIKNTVESLYADPTGSFRKQTYISKIGIYDENRNLIGVAKLAKPLRKREIDAYTFKLKLDF